jgi:ribosomal protein L11 methyltransferase
VRWRELRVTVDREAVESVSEVLRRVAPGGVAIDEPVELGRDEDFIPLLDKPVVVRAYLPIDGTEDEKQRSVAEGIWHLNAIWPVGKLETSEVADEDWATSWKAHYHPVEIGRRFLVRPLWIEVTPEPGRIALDLDPGMAFGTGLHPTTQLCLEALEDLDLAGKRVLDLGTGSGILAIAAKKLGAAAVFALDVDSVAVEAARGNVAANGLGEGVTIGQGTLPLGPPRRFDLVLANIIARVIVDLASELASALEPEGVLVASGIIDDREGEVAAALAEAGLDVEVRRRGDWRAMICHPRTSR